MKNAVVAALVFLVASGTATAEPRYKLNKAQTKVVSLSGLGSGDPCLPDKISGRIAAVNYEANGVVIESFALESKDGSRDLINIDVANIQEANMVTIAWVKEGMQQFIRKGKRVSVGILRCGAAGRVLYLDSVNSK